MERALLAWVTGAGGLIGNYLCEAAGAHARGWRVQPLGRRELDLCDATQVQEMFRRSEPDLIIHCAAVSRSPICQSQPALAWELNVEATRRLCELGKDKRLIFFSTDLVFDGGKGNYDETAEVNPLSVYGETKAAAEQIVLSNPRHTVIRTSLNGGKSPTGDRGFNEDMRNAWLRGECLTLFVDEFRSPIAAEVTARATWELVERKATGLLHLAGADRLSRWEIGQLLAERWPRLNPGIRPGTVKDYAGPPRSPDTSLNCSKVQSLLSFQLPGLREWLKEHPDVEF